jgi:hypothetical protein
LVLWALMNKRYVELMKSRFPSILVVSTTLFISSSALGAEGSDSEIPPPPRPVPPVYLMENSSLGEGKTRMASPAMFGVGAILGGLGLISFVTGYALYKDAPDCTSCPGSEKRGMGTGFMVGGAIGAVIGLPLVFIGARQVPDQPSWARFAPQRVFISPRGGSLQWTF